VEEAEYDVARALMALTHDVLMVGVAEQLAPVLERLAAFQPKLVFNGCESFRGRARHEYALATVLEMHGYRYTGSSPTGLLVARNKSLTKKILAHHGIRVPAFAEFRPGEKPLRPSELRFPLIVKPLLEDAVGAKIVDIGTTALHALWLQDYGRVDLRLTHDDEVYVLEVNPNPFLAAENEMADAAERAGMGYTDFIQRIVDEAMARDSA